jgi:hypothetical protein
MKTLDLDALGVREMSLAQMQDVEGGSLLLITLIAGAVAAVCILLITKNGGHDVDCPLEYEV